MTPLKSLACIALAGVLAFSAPGAAGAAGDDLIRVASPGQSVPETADKLAAAIEGAGARVFARVDHGAGGETVDVDLGEMILVIFGNPAIGSGVMKSAPTAGLDLPQRVLVFSEGGETVMVYRDPAALAAAHGLPADHPNIKKMTGALGKLTAKAAGG